MVSICYICNKIIQSEDNYLCNDGKCIYQVYVRGYIITIGFNSEHLMCKKCIDEILGRIIEEPVYDISAQISVYEKLLKIQDHVELYDTIRTDYTKLKKLKEVMGKI